MNDLISRQAVIDAVQSIGRLATLPDNDAVIRMSAVEYVLFNMPSAQPKLEQNTTSGQGGNDKLGVKNGKTCTDTISRQSAIDALWKALYEYEDKTEKQFIDSEELDVADWIQHRIFVQNMSDIDRQTILGLPSAQPEQPPYVAEIEAEYQKAVKMPHIHKPLAKALYEVWKKHDREDAERRTDGV